MSKTLHELLTEDASDEEILALIADGTDVNEPDPSNMYFRPLQLAVNNKRSERIIRALVEAGADVDAYASADDLTDEDSAELDGDYPHDFFDCSSDLTPLCLAVINKDTASMALLVELGADVNLVCRPGSEDDAAPITFANDKNTLETLIRLGADVNLTYGGYETANKLGWDMEQLDVNAFMVLLQAGAGFFGDDSPADRINSYIENHSEANGDLIRSLISDNSLEHFDYDPFEEENCDNEDYEEDDSEGED